MGSGAGEARAGAGPGAGTGAGPVPQEKALVPETSGRESPPALVEVLGFLSPGKRAVYGLVGACFFYGSWSLGWRARFTPFPVEFHYQVWGLVAFQAVFGAWALQTAWSGRSRVFLPGRKGRNLVVAGGLALSVLLALKGDPLGAAVLLLGLGAGLGEYERLSRGQTEEVGEGPEDEGPVIRLLDPGGGARER